ncbi:hypothetical protein HY442_00225 [Candidatus Parcubacteria bacterium]|nr:hypothetical protein [Candidatus Parcubacteria bacterium]MBI4385587.1 hypothetical protein [Candidatus Parcubacteria bacterium]
MKTILSQLIPFELGGDLTPRIMRRIKREATLIAYQRSLYTVLAISLLSSGLTGYRLFKVMIDRSLTGFSHELTHYFATEGVSLKALWEVGFTFRQFFPLVEVGLFVLNIGAFAFLVKRSLNVRRQLAVQPVSVTA